MAEYHQINLSKQDESFRCKTSESVLHGMARLGKKGIPLGCRGGGCGVCKIQVLQGDYQRKTMSRSHISPEEERQGCVLACRIYPSSSLDIKVVGKMSKNVHRESS